MLLVNFGLFIICVQLDIISDTFAQTNVFPSRGKRQDDGDQPWWAQGNNRPFNSATTEPPSPDQWWLQTERTTTRRSTRRTTRRTTTVDDRPVWSADSTTARATTTRRPTGQKSKSEMKCDEYSALVRLSVGALPLTPDADPVYQTVEKCDYAGLELIVGGTKTAAGEFPHMAAIGYRGTNGLDWDCGGSLISDFFVLTAAHCGISQKGPPIMVRLGEQDLKSDNDGAKPTNYRIAQVVRHPGHKPPARYNDIALLRLAQQVKFNKFVRPACLYNRDTFEVQTTIATGWGLTGFTDDSSSTLLKVALSIMDSNMCDRAYASEKKTNKLKDGIVASMLCAGDVKGGKDTCQGDSGGPIQIPSPKNQCIHNVIGITSFGKFCGFNTPAVYTRVSSYVTWIESIVWP